MSVAPPPSEIFQRAVEEGERRLDQSALELVSTSFIAGFTIIFGIVTQGIVHALVEPQLGDIAKIVGALAFAPGLVFLVVGRAELFNENFFDPTATIAERRDAELLPALIRLWILTFVFNIVGGVFFILIMSVDGMLAPGTATSLSTKATEIAQRGPIARFAGAIVGGTLVSLLSFLLVAVNSVGTRLVLAYIVGFLLALGPFDHVIVSVFHVIFGIQFGASVGYGTVAVIALITTVGNLVGGVGLVTTTHVAQAT